MRISDWSSDVCSSDLSIRGSILFEPTPSIRNILIVEYFNAPENPSGNVVAGISPGIATIEQFFDAPTRGNYPPQTRDFAPTPPALRPLTPPHAPPPRPPCRATARPPAQLPPAPPPHTHTPPP